MNRLTLHQLWNQRRANAWLLAELIIVTYFLWGAIDPVYVILSNRAIPDGYDLSDTYLLQVKSYHSGHRLFRQEATTDSAQNADFKRIVERIEHYPGVTATTVVLNGSYPQSGSWSGSAFKHDTLRVDLQCMCFLSGTDYFGVFRIKNAKGQVIPPVPAGTKAYYLTQNAAQRLFLKGDAKGECFFTRTNDTLTQLRVQEVLPVIQSRSVEQPYPLLLETQDKLSVSTSRVEICFRVRDGLASQALTDKLKKELSPLCQSGNFQLSAIHYFPVFAQKLEAIFGTTGTVRLQICLVSFFLLCTFLGMVGTFWLRSNARREEIGLRMALGSTQQMIHRQFLFEAWVLTTIGFFIGLFLVFQHVWHDGFAQATRNGDLAYWQNQPVAHFLFVSLLVYLLLVIIAIIGTWIPAARAARTQPVEALRDE